VPFPVRRGRMVAGAAPVAGGPRLEAGWPVGSLRWAEFEAAAPELAARGRALVERFGFVLAGAVRAGGTPRISPVAARLVSGDLMLVMIPGTQKARDVLRDWRIVLQSPVTDAAGARRGVQAARTSGRDHRRRSADRDRGQHRGGQRLAAAANLAVPGRHRAGRRSPGMGRRGDDADPLGWRPRDPAGPSAGAWALTRECTAAWEGSHPDAAAASGAPPSHPKPRRAWLGVAQQRPVIAAVSVMMRYRCGSCRCVAGGR
jgi:hypothetical protein